MIDFNKYIKLPEKHWDGTTPLYSCRYSKIFKTAGDIHNFMLDIGGCDIEYLQLTMCDPHKSECVTWVPNDFRPIISKDLLQDTDMVYEQ